MKQCFVFFILFFCVYPVLPAQEYFQQQVNYTISVSLNDVEHSLTGYESVEYINNSPDQLKYLVFHLWPNAYKNNTTAFARQQIDFGNTRFQYATDDERGYIDSLDFRINNQKVACLPDDNHTDICKIVLPKALMPGDTMVITTPFYVKIPGPFSRFGHVGQSYQISQWYPKPAVYDQHGWNPMPYLDEGEFYSEYGSFHVAITLPKNYVVGATGNLVTREEIEWLNKKITDTTLVDNFPASDQKLKTIRYQENNVHDFAWFADKRYCVKRGEVVLNNGHKVNTWAMFTHKQAILWENSITYINDAVRYYSEWYGNYPYDNCSAVYGSIQAGGAMEYPTITVVGNTSSPAMLEDFIMHEVGHNWFYGMLGFNERRYPYLDEGINTFSEFRYMRTKYPGLKLHEWLMNKESISRLLNINDLPYGAYFELLYLIPARSYLDQSLNLESEAYTSSNYGAIVYYKSSLIFTYLLQYLGEDKFNQIMQKFFREWQFKHPGPDDLRKVFETNCSEDLSWIFDDLIGTTKRIDYAVRGIRPDKVLVKNRGEIASPLKLSSLQGDRIQQVKWFPGFIGKQWLDLSVQSGEKVVLFDSVWLPEINRKNNTYRTHGVLKWIEPLNIRPLQIIEKPSKTLVGVFPVTGWNNYNKVLLGVLLYSPLFPQQKMEYQLMPMIGLGNHDIAGMGRVSFALHPESNVIQSVQLGVNAQRFGFGIRNSESYLKAGGEIELTFKNTNVRSHIHKTLIISGTTVSQSNLAGAYGFFKNYFLDLNATYSSNHVLHPYNFNFIMEKSNDFLKSSLEINASQTLGYAHNALQVRLYAACFLNSKSDLSDVYALRLSGASGVYDYKYEHLYLGRFEQLPDNNRQPFLSQQFIMNGGGFASNNPLAFTKRWLVSAGVTLRIPKIPVSIFVNTGTYSGAGDTYLYRSEEREIISGTISYEAGAMVHLGTFIRVYFPFIFSKEISGVNDLFTDNYWQTIRYCIDFNAVNPFKIKNSIF